MTAEILVPVSFGELLDKISILQIKSERISDEGKLANVRKELSALETTWMAHPAAVKDIAKLRAELKAVNEQLWDIEDDIRLKEKAQAFDQGFVDLARSVYLRNDERARIKALKRAAEAQEARDLAASGADQQPILTVQSPDRIRDLWS